MAMTGILGVTPSIIIDKSNMTPKEKKTSATIAGTILGGVGLTMINDATKGKSFVWNTAINKNLKNVAKKAGEFVKNNSISKYAGKIAPNNKFVSGFGKGLQSIANSGANVVKNISTKIAKTSGRQKLLTAVAVGTLALVMAARERFSKQEGMDEQFKKDARGMSVILENNNKIFEKKLEAKDQKITELETELDIKNQEVKNYENLIEKVDNAAVKLGVDEKIAAEIIKDELKTE